MSIFVLLLVTVCVAAATIVVADNPEKSNIIFVLTDDQDEILGGRTPMVKMKKLLEQEGTVFTNAFVTSPICCPSRSSILSGRYVHNHGAHNNSIEGNCAGQEWLDDHEKKTVAVALKTLGYRTMFAGKYLNQYGTGNSPSSVNHVPPGWDDWLGLCGNSQYYDYCVSDNGVKIQHGSDYALDYFTDVIANRSFEFLTNTTRDFPESPFFMMLATPASHGPDTAAPQYEDAFPNATSPRTPNFNVWGQGKHWLMRYQVPMDAIQAEETDETLRKRWRTLLSVDDMIETLVSMLDERNILDNT